MAYWDRNRSAAHPSGHYALYHFAPLGIPSLIFRARQRMPPRPYLAPSLKNVTALMRLPSGSRMKAA